MDLVLCLLHSLSAASVQVVPNRAQFFQYEKVFLSCPSEWTIMRNTSLHRNQRNLKEKSSWFFNYNIYYRDTGVYWCQSQEGQCGATINITVTAADVILESPVQPVTEGETVTLRCLANPNKPDSEGTFEFFKDSLWLGKNMSGELTLSRVSVEDAGLYMCRNAEELSAESHLQVRTVGHPPQANEDDALDSSTSSAVVVAFPVTVVSLILLCLALACVRRKHKKREKHDVEYSNVTVVHTPMPRRLKDLQTEDESTFYSMLQLNFMQ